jgi:hypothetical protein
MAMSDLRSLAGLVKETGGSIAVLVEPKAGFSNGANFETLE